MTMKKTLSSLLNPANVQFVKYLFVGGINFVFGLVAFYFFLNILLINYLISLLITSVLGIVLTYIINFLWVFKPEDKIQFKGHFVKYFSAQLASILINMFVLRLIVVNTNNDPYWVQMALIPFIIAFNFFTAKYWSLRGKKE